MVSDAGPKVGRLVGSNIGRSRTGEPDRHASAPRRQRAAVVHGQCMIRDQRRLSTSVTKTPQTSPSLISRTLSLNVRAERGLYGQFPEEPRGSCCQRSSSWHCHLLSQRNRSLASKVKKL